MTSDGTEGKILQDLKLCPVGIRNLGRPCWTRISTRNFGSDVHYINRDFGFHGNWTRAV